MDFKHLIEAAFLPWGLMMVPRRREEDEREAAGKLLGLLKPMMMPTFTAMLAVVGVSAGPVEQVHQNVDALKDQVIAAKTELVQVASELTALREKVQDISARRTQQVSDLERRILACELQIAEAHGRRK